MAYAHTHDQVENIVCTDFEAVEEGKRFLAARVQQVTPKGVGLLQKGTRDLLWLPKSQCDIREMNDGTAYVCVREWLADEKDFTKVEYLDYTIR